MHTAYDIASDRLNALAGRVAVWRPGQYAGGLYAEVADALAALTELEPAQAAFCRERFERLLARLGICCPRVDDVAGSAPWRCVGVVKSPVDPWHLAKLLHVLFPQPSFRAHVAKPGPPSVEVWVAMTTMAAHECLRQIEAALARPNVRRVVGNCLVLALPD